MTANWAGSPRNWSTGELTSSALNIEIRDRLDWLRAALMLHGIDSATTRGQLVGARYGARVTLSSQSVPGSTDRTLMWGSVVHDDDHFWTGTTPARITFPAGGTYVIKTWAVYAASDRGSWRGLEILLNGSDVYALDRRPPAGTSVQTTVACSEELSLSAGDYITVRTRHNSDTDLDINEATLTVRRVAMT